METLRYFPQHQIVYLGGISRKSLVHDNGVLLNKYGEQIDPDDRPIRPRKSDYDNIEEFNQAREAYQESVKNFREEMRESYKLVDLTGKILVFLESPDLQTLDMLRPILSHDKEEIPYKFVDRTAGGQGQLKTMNVVIRGWPAAIFLSTDRKYLEEQATRGFSVSPEDSTLKITEANILTNDKLSLLEDLTEETESFKLIRFLIERLADLTSKGKVDVKVPFLNLYELFPKEQVRDMRDFAHFGQFLQAVTLLHVFQRPFTVIEDKQYVLTTVDDVKRAYNVYMEIIETTRTGMEKRILDFYWTTIATKRSGTWYVKELTAEWNSDHSKKLSEQSIRLMLEKLVERNYVNDQKDDEDSRKHTYSPLKFERAKNPLETDFETSLKPKLEKGFIEWLKRYSNKIVFQYYKNSETGFSEQPITEDELRRIILEGEKIFALQNSELLEQPSEPISKPVQQEKPEDISKQETKGIFESPEKGSLLIRCPVCATQGKQMLFNSDKDLELHLVACHGQAS
jgi:predicted transcriptional regulator